MASSQLARDGVQTVETYEVVTAVAALLQADAPFLEHVTYSPDDSPGGWVHAHRLSVAGGLDPESAAMYAIVREMQGRATRETPSGMITVHVQLFVSIDEQATDRPDQALSYAHVLAHRALEGAMLGGGEGDGSFRSTAPVSRPDTPGPSMQDGFGRLFSASVFTVPVVPMLPAGM